MGVGGGGWGIAREGQSRRWCHTPHFRTSPYCRISLGNSHKSVGNCIWRSHLASRGSVALGYRPLGFRVEPKASHLFIKSESVFLAAVHALHCGGLHDVSEVVLLKTTHWHACVVCVCVRARACMCLCVCVCVCVPVSLWGGTRPRPPGGGNGRRGG